MEYLSDKPFKVGGYTPEYGAHYDAIFKKPIPSERPTAAAEEDRDGHEGALGNSEERVEQAQAQGPMLPVQAAQEAREELATQAGPGGRTS